MVNETDDGGRLSDGEFQQMNVLLRRFCSHDLDQFEALRSETPYGPVYIIMTRSLPQALADTEFYDL
ncbi:hypothetical protein [Streptomyces sp. NBC_01431]|uniref:hypothetical protein n=1 Tax=Streptomyces sp. NBC_01431 TaxID=2903863 RepID=UPI002E379247|nr:hypothetical protein [Streptomyces sp. NBC_01431]